MMGRGTWCSPPVIIFGVNFMPMVHREKDILNARRCKSITNLITGNKFEQFPGDQWVTLFLDCIMKPMEFRFEFEGKSVDDEGVTKRKYTKAELQPMPAQDVMTIARKWGIPGTDKRSLIPAIMDAQAEYNEPVTV
jgi:hypothetical protein